MVYFGLQLQNIRLSSDRKSSGHKILYFEKNGRYFNVGLDCRFPKVVNMKDNIEDNHEAERVVQSNSSPLRPLQSSVNSIKLWCFFPPLPDQVKRLRHSLPDVEIFPLF